MDSWQLAYWLVNIIDRFIILRCDYSFAAMRRSLCSRLFVDVSETVVNFISFDVQITNVVERAYMAVFSVCYVKGPDAADPRVHTDPGYTLQKAGSLIYATDIDPEHEAPEFELDVTKILYGAILQQDLAKQNVVLNRLLLGLMTTVADTLSDLLEESLLEMAGKINQQRFANQLYQYTLPQVNTVEEAAQVDVQGVLNIIGDMQLRINPRVAVPLL